MGVSNTITFTRHVASGSSTSFAYLFYAKEESHVRVDVDGVDKTGNISSVTGVNNSGGGVITLDYSPSFGSIVTVYRKIPGTHDLSIQSSNFPFTDLGNNTDKEALFRQDVYRELDRTIRLPLSETDEGYVIDNKTDRAGKLLEFDVNGKPVTSRNFSDVKFTGPIGRLTVNNISVLEGINASSLEDGTQADVRGYYEPGDGGGGRWEYVESGLTANGYTVMAATGGGYWRLILEKPKTVNVLKLGIKNDNSANFVRRFQAITDALGHGWTYEFPAGTYQYGGQLVAADGTTYSDFDAASVDYATQFRSGVQLRVDNITIRGAGAATIFQATNDFNVISTYGTSGSPRDVQAGIFQCVNGANLTFQDFAFITASPEATYLSAFALYGCKNVKIEGITTERTNLIFGRLYPSGSNPLPFVKNMDGISLTATTTSHSGETVLRDVNENVTIRNCSGKGKSGFTFDWSKSIHQYGLYASWIHLPPCKGFEVSNCEVDTSGFGFSGYGYGAFDRLGDFVDASEYPTESEFLLRDGVFDNCRAINGSAGVFVFGAKNVHIKNCTARDMADIGIDFECSLDCSASHNYVEDCRAGNYAVLFNCRDILFSDNISRYTALALDRGLTQADDVFSHYHIGGISSNSTADFSHDRLKFINNRGYRTSDAPNAWALDFKASDCINIEIVDNKIDGALRLAWGASATVAKALVKNNTLSDGGIDRPACWLGQLRDAANVEITDNTFRRKSSGTSAAIRIDRRNTGEVNVRLADNTLLGGWPTDLDFKVFTGDGSQVLKVFMEGNLMSSGQLDNDWNDEDDERSGAGITVGVAAVGLQLWLGPGNVMPNGDDWSCPFDYPKPCMILKGSVLHPNWTPTNKRPLAIHVYQSGWFRNRIWRPGETFNHGDAIFIRTHTGSTGVMSVDGPGTSGTSYPFTTFATFGAVTDNELNWYRVNDNASRALWDAVPQQAETGSGAPTSEPIYIGQRYRDTGGGYYESVAGLLTVGPAEWVANMEVQTSGAFVVPSTPNGFYYQATSGFADGNTSGATEPTWPTTAGGTVVDGDITWTARAFWQAV